MSPTDTLKKRIVGLLPPRVELKARYYYRRALGALEREMSLLPWLVPPGFPAIDVGANDGLYTFALSRLATKVEAFEPQPWCAALIVGARLPNVAVHELCLGDTTGDVVLNIPILDGCRNTGLASLRNQPFQVEKIRVPVARLDDMDLPTAGFIKIDVEGHELRVIDGGHETIMRTRPRMLVEIEARHHPEADIGTIFSGIIAMGYRGLFLANNQLQRLSDFRLDLHQNCLNDIPGTSTYVNNFIFLPEELPLLPIEH